MFNALSRPVRALSFRRSVCRHSTPQYLRRVPARETPQDMQRRCLSEENLARYVGDVVAIIGLSLTSSVVSQGRLGRRVLRRVTQTAGYWRYVVPYVVPFLTDAE